jgi:hypothetical protein
LISRRDVLIPDDPGCLHFAQTGGQRPFHLIGKLCEWTSIIVTPNRAFGERPTVLGDAKMPAARLNRLTHQREIVDTGKEGRRFKNRAA